MRESNGLAGDLLLAAVLVVAGLVKKLLGVQAAGFGVVFGGWAAVLVFIARTARGPR